MWSVWILFIVRACFLMQFDSFIEQRHTYSRLLINRELFETLMSEFNILPRFREFLLLFGAKHGESEIGPPQLRSRRIIDTAENTMKKAYGGFGILCFSSLQGCGLTRAELAYGLRYVELNNRNPAEPWSIRQTAIYHKFRAISKASTWVMVSASKRAEQCIDRYVKSCVDLSPLNPFEIHLIVLDTTLATWRPYIVSLTEKIRQQVISSISFGTTH